MSKISKQRTKLIEALEWLKSNPHSPRGIQLLKDLADQNVVVAIEQLSDTYFGIYRESGDELDGKQAIHYLNLGVSLGSRDCTYNLASIYDQGYGLVLQNKEYAIELYTKSANQGKPEAMHNLGASYLIGDGVDKDAAKAESWFLRACAIGNPLSQLALGRLLIAGDEGVKQNIERGQQLVRIAMKDEYVRAIESGKGENTGNIFGDAHEVRVPVSADYVMPCDSDIEHYMNPLAVFHYESCESHHKLVSTRAAVLKNQNIGECPVCNALKTIKTKQAFQKYCDKVMPNQFLVKEFNGIDKPTKIFSRSNDDELIEVAGKGTKGSVTPKHFIEGSLYPFHISEKRWIDILAESADN